MANFETSHANITRPGGGLVPQRPPGQAAAKPGQHQGGPRAARDERLAGDVGRCHCHRSRALATRVTA